MVNYSILQYAKVNYMSTQFCPPLTSGLPCPHLAAEGLETLETGVVVKVISFRGEVIDTP